MIFGEAENFCEKSSYLSINLLLVVTVFDRMQKVEYSLTLMQVNMFIMKNARSFGFTIFLKLYLKCRSNGFEFFFFSKNHLHQVNPETKSRCGCVDNISWGDAVFVLFCLQCFCIQNSPCLPQWTKSTKEIKFLFVPKLLLFKIFHIFLSKRLQVRDYHPTITLSFKANLLNAI